MATLNVGGDALQGLAWLDADAALAALEAQRAGLTEEEVERRRELYGRNDVAHEKPPAWYAQLLHAFANPFNILLAVLATVSALTGDDKAVIVIGLMVTLSTGLRFVQEFRSTTSAESLRALVRTSTAVERDAGAAAPRNRDG
jgi:Mg2+-importing ATPase